MLIKALWNSQKHNKKKGVKGVTTALVENSCLKETSKGHYFFHIRLHNLTLISEGKPQKIKKSDYSDFSSYLITKNGKVLKFWTTEREHKTLTWVTAIKKGIVGNLQTMINGKERLEHQQEGDFVVHYSQKTLPNGSLLVEGAKMSQDCVKTGDPNQRRRDAKSSSNKYNIIRNGVQYEVVQNTGSVVGKHKKKTAKSFDKKKILLI